MPGNGLDALEAFRTMFEPWIGANYCRQNPKTLILGKSHYGDAHIKWDYPIEQKTIRSIQEQTANAWPSRFHTKIVATMIGHLPTLDEKKQFWNSVAYHNLITEPMTASRIAPTMAQWNKSVATLATVMQDLEPDYCLCLGYRMWNVLRLQIKHQPIESPFDIGPCGAFQSEGFRCVFHGMHPSGRGFRRSVWHERIAGFRIARWGHPPSV